MMTVEEAVEILSTTYLSLDAVAQGMVVCLKVLSKYNT